MALTHTQPDSHKHPPTYTYTYTYTHTHRGWGFLCCPWWVMQYRCSILLRNVLPCRVPKRLPSSNENDLRRSPTQQPTVDVPEALTLLKSLRFRKTSGMVEQSRTTEAVGSHLMGQGILKKRIQTCYRDDPLLWAVPTSAALLPFSFI